MKTVTKATLTRYLREALVRLEEQAKAGPTQPQDGPDLLFVQEVRRVLNGQPAPVASPPEPTTLRPDWDPITRMYFPI